MPHLLRPPRRAFGRAASAVLVVAASGLAAACSAMSPAPRPTTDRVGQRVEVSVVDRASGQRLPVWSHRGERWIAGTPGAGYALRVTNRTPRRVLAVMSVDGVNIVTGQTAGTAQSGYVLEPWQSAEITGWRKSESHVAAFHFTALPGSYAALTGRPANVGVIGVAVFAEREPPPRAPDVAAEAGGVGRLAAPPAPAAAARADREADESRGRRERLGTGHGALEPSWSSTTTFERAGPNPAEVVAIRYDSADNLVAAGVIPRRPAPVPVPMPFPVAMPGYVPDPPQR